MRPCTNVFVDDTPIDENLVWESAHGVKTRIKDMDDTYLANLRDYLTKRAKLFPQGAEFDTKLITVIDKLIKARGLKKGFLKRAQIPYKNPKGQWEIWNFKKFRPMVLEKEKV